MTYAWLSRVALWTENVGLSLLQIWQKLYIIISCRTLRCTMLVMHHTNHCYWINFHQRTRLINMWTNKSNQILTNLQRHLSNSIKWFSDGCFNFFIVHTERVASVFNFLKSKDTSSAKYCLSKSKALTQYRYTLVNIDRNHIEINFI